MTENKKNLLQPPRAVQKPHRTNIHGIALEDDYYWLRARDDKEVTDYLKAENSFTDQQMQGTRKIQDEIYTEMLARIKQTDQSVPVKVDEYYYYNRTIEGKEYKIHCRRKGGLEAREEILIDVNALAHGHAYFHLGGLLVSPDHTMLVYWADTDGSEDYTMSIKDLSTGRMIDEPVKHTSPAAEWSEDNQHLFYTVIDEAKRPYMLKRHRVGENTKDDREVYRETDEAYFLSISKTKDRKYLMLELESKVTTETHILPADQPDGSFAVFDKRRHGVESYIEHHDKGFYILTNDQAVNFRLMYAPPGVTDAGSWQEILPHRSDVMIEDMDIFKKYLVLYERHSGLHQIRVEELDTRKVHYIKFDEAAYTLWGDANPMYETRILRFGYSSLIQPVSIFDYDLVDRTKKLLKETEVLGGYDPDLYAAERLMVPSHDGREVPVSLVYRKNLFKADGTNPLFLYGYGSYGISVDPAFSSNRISLLDRGFVYAIAHIRGGGDLGRAWYEDGKYLQKKNTFHDYIAVAEHLIKAKYTASDRMAFYGGSAGGLLMGAVANMRPDLPRVIIADVPFVDVINTMLDETIPLTVTEYEEWGNPQEKEYFDYIRSYSPYENVRKQDYPHILVMAGLSDPRVQYWEPAKWCAKLRIHKTDQNELLLKTNMGAGHGGPSGRYAFLKEITFEYAFVLKHIRTDTNLQKS